MEKYLLFTLSCMFFSCFKSSSGIKQATQALDPDRFGHYTGSLHEGNYIWSGAMNLCWTELSQAVLRAPLTLQTDDAAALAMTECFNRPVCTTADLDAPSYYVKAGFGPKTLEAINRECRAKFPQKSFGDLRMELAADDMISYTYFLKKVAYETPFTRCNMAFEGQKVAGFEALDDQKRALELLQYEDDNRFILRIRLKDRADELLLAKGFDTSQPAAVLRALERAYERKPTRLTDTDFFKMPLLRLQCRRDYQELIGKRLANQGFAGYAIGQMFENIAFELDETGARVESQAVISVERSATPQKRRYLYLDQPFWVVMKRANSPRPYFLLGVKRSNIMQAV